MSIQLSKESPVSTPSFKGRFSALFAAFSLYFASNALSEANAAMLDKSDSKLPPVAEQISHMQLGNLVQPFLGETAMLYVHKVRAGENLRSIAKRYLLNEESYKDIVKLNQIKDPSKLKIGQALCLILKGEQIDANFDADIVAFPSMSGRVLHLFSYQTSRAVKTDSLLSSFYPGINKEQIAFIKGLNQINDSIPTGKKLWLPWAKTGLERPVLQITSTAHPVVSESLPLEPDTQTKLAGNLPKEILHGVEPALVQAIIKKESTGNPRALGEDGEIGLMQIKPSTAQWVARKLGMPIPSREQLFNPKTNIEFGTAYLKLILDKHDGNVTYALMEYNMGAGDFAQLKSENGGKIPTWEVTPYARTILADSKKGVVAFVFAASKNESGNTSKSKSS